MSSPDPAIKSIQAEPRLQCVHCQGHLEWPNRNVTSLTCQCSAVFQVIQGIADMRTAQDPYCGNEHDLKIAQSLLAKLDQFNFNQMLEYYYREFCPELKPEDITRQIRHIQNDSSRLILQICNHHQLQHVMSMLDLGCGSGGAMIQMARFQHEIKIVGLDVAMRWLLLARKRLDEAGLAHVPLVCANAEQMPFEDESFDLIHGGDMIEHVLDPAGVFRESARVLATPGQAAFLTPNRFSPTREPHVGLYFAGWLPAKWAAVYCRWAGAPPWRGIFTRSARGWQKSMRQGLLGLGATVDFGVAPAQVGVGDGGNSGLIGLYDLCLGKSRLFRGLARLFGPVLRLTIHKRDG